MGLKDVVRMCEGLSNSLNREEIASNPWIINALFEIVRTAFYPAWQAAVNPGIGNDVALYLIEFMRQELLREWKNQTFEVCNEIGEALEIPDYIRTLIIDYFGDFIWDLVWDLTNPFFEWLYSSRKGKDKYEYLEHRIDRTLINHRVHKVPGRGRGKRPGSPA